MYKNSRRITYHHHHLSLHCHQYLDHPLHQYFTVPLVVCMDSTQTAWTTQNLSTVHTESVQNSNKFHTVLVESKQTILGQISQPIFLRRMSCYYKVQEQSKFILS